LDLECRDAISTPTTPSNRIDFKRCKFLFDTNGTFVPDQCEFEVGANFAVRQEGGVSVLYEGGEFAVPVARESNKVAVF
jgi:hypothetical protein